MRWTAAALLLPSLMASCNPPNTPALNETLAPDDRWNQVVLDGRDRDRAVAIMRETSTVADPEFPFPAPRGVRWSDVPAAASAAAAEVEMAVVRAARLNAPDATPDPDWRDAFLAKPPASLVGDPGDGRERWVFEVKSIRDERGWLVVVRDPGAARGEVGPASAEIGVVGERTADANALVDAFARQLRELGAKPGFKND